MRQYPLWMPPLLSAVTCLFMRSSCLRDIMEWRGGCVCVCVFGGEGGGLHEWCEGVKGWGRVWADGWKRKAFKIIRNNLQLRLRTFMPGPGVLNRISGGGVKRGGWGGVYEILSSGRSGANYLEVDIERAFLLPTPGSSHRNETNKRAQQRSHLWKHITKHTCSSFLCRPSGIWCMGSCPKAQGCVSEQGKRQQRRPALPVNELKKKH